MSHTDLDIAVQASGGDDLTIKVTTNEVADRAETTSETWEFTIPRTVWQEFMQLAAGFRKTVRVHRHEED
jgi:hypothetical protein